MGCRGRDDADKPSGMEEKSHPQHAPAASRTCIVREECFGKTENSHRQ
jgi:hypothetical protein